MWYIVVILLTNISNVNVVGEYKRLMAIHVAYLIGGFSTRSFEYDTRHSEPLLTINCSNEHRFCSHNKYPNKVSCYIVCIISGSYKMLLNVISFVSLPLIVDTLNNKKGAANCF